MGSDDELRLYNKQLVPAEYEMETLKLTNRYNKCHNVEM